MRLLGKINNANEARLAQGLLISRKIGCQLEGAGDSWELWALNEDQLLEARTLFQQFLADPFKEQYAPLALQAEEMIAAALAQQQKENAEAARRVREAVAVFSDRPTPLSWAVIGICAALWLLQTVFPDVLPVLYDALKIAPLREDSLNAVMNGQIWRLFTPALLHAPVTLPNGEFVMFNILHIFFNLLWMKDLAPLIEKRHGAWYLLALLLVVAGGGNLVQYFWGGPNFLGLSGVVYGLLGFLWMRGRTDPDYAIQLNGSIVFFMLVWLVLCLFTSGMANGCHLGGLAIGAAWGALSGMKRN